MPVSKRDPHRFVLNDFKDVKRKEGSITIEAGDREFVVDPPELWSDEALANAEDVLAIGALVMGDDEYAAFVAAGGSGGVLLKMLEEVHGVKAGE